MRSKSNRLGLMLGSRSRRGNTDNPSELLVNVSDPSGPASEAYRTLRTNLLHARVDTPPKSIAITSPDPSAGKSTTCANLGVALAQAGKSTLVVDCDLRRPFLHKFFAGRNTQGLIDVLAGERRMEEIWQEPAPRLWMITAGSPPPDPAEILASKSFAGFLGRVRQEFDYVILDAPPMDVVSDPLVIAPQVDGVVLVLDAQNTRKWAVRQSVRALEGVGANLLGTVMNNSPIRQSASHRDYMGY